MPIEFILFSVTLVGIALFHHRTLLISSIGFMSISLYKLIFTGYKTGVGLIAFAEHLNNEWVLLANLLGLLTGFALLARQFEESHLPAILPNYLPTDWEKAFALLAIIFILASFLDNIAAALIGGTMASQLFKTKIHVGYLAGIVAASNAGGAGSVVGDTTTTMLWISGVSPLQVLHAYIASYTALFVFGIFVAKQQDAYSPMIKNIHQPLKVDLGRISIVAIMLLAALGTNVAINLFLPNLADSFPWIGVSLWLSILATSWLRPYDWKLLPETIKGSLFLLLLVLGASLMPVEKLPIASWQTSFGLGFISAFFDNIPLTALAIKQGSYDWGLLAFSVGFVGSMFWFRSSAGVALASMYPKARDAKQWLKQGWHIVSAFVIGFFAMFAVQGWQPATVQPQ